MPTYRRGGRPAGVTQAIAKAADNEVVYLPAEPIG
jgi:hypothetical protein